MRVTWLDAALVLQYCVIVTGTAPAPLLGPGYPAPTNFSCNGSLISAAWSNFTTTLDSYISKNQKIEDLVPDLGSYSISVGGFSINDPNAAKTLQYHYTGPDVKSSNLGDNEVSSTSIYRVESITKVFTVYLALIEIGSVFWDRPITDFVSDLSAFANKTRPDPISVVDWKSVTLGSLAGQIAGIPRDTALINSDLLATSRIAQLVALGLPPINATASVAVDPCINFLNTTGTITNCPVDDFLQAVTQRAPTFLPWSTPIYTNLGFDLLALATENITGRGFLDMFQKDMFDPLGMMSTSVIEPSNLTRAIIPGGKKSRADVALESTTVNALASGGVYSSTDDLAKFGISILNSTLLCPEETRKWLKPITHKASLGLSVGRPWEIFRITQPSTGRVNDLYTKEGDGKGYSSYLILSPDHGAGFSILIAGNASTVIANTVIADTLSSTVIPALEAQAAAEATRNYAGQYSSTTPTLNSSVKLAVDPSYGAGLIVKSWISNSTDMLAWLALQGNDELSLFETDLRTAPRGQAGQVAFRATFGNSKYKANVGPFTDQVTSGVVWENVDSLSYAGVGLDLFVFSVDEKGEAVAVSPAATKATLQKDK